LKVHAIIEVKGKEGYANNEDIRELLQWWTEKLEEDENVKGIFILNHFRKINPEDRKKLCKEKLKEEDPFTKAAQKIAENNHFCLMTTYQLFQIYRKYLEKKIKKEDIIKLLKQTEGALQDSEIEKLFTAD